MDGEGEEEFAYPELQLKKEELEQLQSLMDAIEKGTRRKNGEPHEGGSSILEAILARATRLSLGLHATATRRRSLG